MQFVPWLDYTAVCDGATFCTYVDSTTPVWLAAWVLITLSLCDNHIPVFTVYDDSDVSHKHAEYHMNKYIQVSSNGITFLIMHANKFYELLWCRTMLSLQYTLQLSQKL